MTGLFVVFEGLDGAGKTTVINELMKNSNQRYYYSKGIGSNTSIGRFARKHPSSLLFMLELAYITQRHIKPALRQDRIVLQDRYDYSVLSNAKNGDTKYPNFIRNLFSPFLLKPDILIYVRVEKKLRLERLTLTNNNRYHQQLIDHPELIDMREEQYQRIYSGFSGIKYIVDTTNKLPKDIASDLETRLAIIG